MLVKFSFGKCNNCEKSVEVPVDASSLQELTFTLDGYKKYKNQHLCRCLNCGLVSPNIFSQELNQDIKSLIASRDYHDVLSYEEFTGYDMGESFFESYNANYYECYSLICERLGQYDKAVCALFRCIELKEIIKRRYNYVKLEDFEDYTEEELEKFEELATKLNSSIEQNCEHLLVLFESTSKGTFSRIICIETLVKLNELGEAEEIFNKLLSQNDISEDLINYVKELISSV